MTSLSRRFATVATLLGMAWADLSHAQTCPEPLGILDSFLVQGQRLGTIDTQRFAVERDQQAVPMNIGDPLCEGDRMATAADTTAQLLVGPAEGARHGLTVLPGATVVLKAVNRVELLVGRLIGSVRGNFDVVMPFARLAATGTEFEVEVTSDGCNVEQLEGSTHLTPTASATAVLDPLRSTTCVPGASTAIVDLPVARCEALVENSSRIDVAGRPAVPSTNTVRQMRPGEAAEVYSTARKAAICHQEGNAWQAVGRVLTDWDRPQQALNTGVGVGPAGAEDFIARGRALLLRGRPADAQEQFQRAVTEQGVTVASAAGLGDSERTLGLEAIRAADLARAGRHFESASRHYVEAIEKSQTEIERGTLLVDLGDLALLRTALDRDASAARLAEASSYFERARRHGDPPHARLGLARISMLRARLIPTQTIDSSEAPPWDLLKANIALVFLSDLQRKPHWQEARRELAALTASVPNFSPAEELLGEVLYETGDRDDAKLRFKRAIAADPGNTSAYRAYSNTLSKEKKAMYARTYTLVEVTAVRELQEVERKVLVPEVKTVPIPATPMTADASALNFTSPERTRQVLTLTNRSETTANTSEVNIRGPNAEAFRVTANSCGDAPIAASGECRIEVEFTAQTPGQYRATLSLAFSGIALNSEIRLSGEVIQLPASVVIL